MITFCHKCESECYKCLNEMMTELGFEEYECPCCGEKFLVPLEVFKTN